MLDRHYGALLDEMQARGDLQGVALAAYTASLHTTWRNVVLRVLGVQGGWRVLDVGSGLGLLAFELAANLPVQVEGIDLEPDFVAGADDLRRRLEAEHGFFAGGASVRFGVGDVMAVPFADREFDLVVVRELMQFLADPVGATAELHRVCKPGGHVCVSDIDDQLYITWPEPSPAFERLHRAVDEVQRGRGGDRHVGRKLTTFLRAADFDVASVLVVPEAQHLASNEVEHRLVLTQLEDARTRIVEEGAMTGADYDEAMAELRAEGPHEQFRMNARIVAIGRRPLG